MKLAELIFKVGAGLENVERGQRRKIRFRVAEDIGVINTDVVANLGWLF